MRFQVHRAAADLEKDISVPARKRWLTLSRILAFLLFHLTLLPHLQAAEKLQFNRDVRPILSDRCFKCHGPDKASRKGNFRLDLREEALAPRKKSQDRPIVPGKPKESLLVERIFSTDEEEMMPPPESHLSLSPQQKETLRRWIAEGAEYQPHWAFIPPADSIALPAVKNKKWPRNPIDRFVLARLEKSSIPPSPEAERTRWLRRVTYDLTGLPPTPMDVDRFLSDKSARAYEQVVDRLLASKHFGERMAVPWLDGARYADSYGYQSDQLSPTWPYRDWVVEAFNDNLSYDKFLLQQLAGDLLPNATRKQRLATAFNRLHRQTNEGGSIEEEWRIEYVSDRVHTFGTTFLALTFECARCHDHKFDPISQRDYYSLSAFFNSIDEWGMYDNAARVPTPSLLLPTPEQEKAMASTAETLKFKNDQLAATTTSVESDFENWFNSADLAPEIPGLVGRFNFDQVVNTNQLANSVNATNFSTGLRGNKLAPGRSGQALQFNGDEEVTFPNLVGSLQPWEQYSVVFWLKIPGDLTNALLFHRSEGTDTGFHGTEFSLDQGHLFFAIKRFWPGNAIAVRSEEIVTPDRWVQIGVSYDGSARAEGMSLFIDGQKTKSRIVRNQLFKSPQNGGSGFTFGARMRTFGLKEALLDDLEIYHRPLAAIEFRQLFDGRALKEAIEQKNREVVKPYYLAAVSTNATLARASRANAVKVFLETRNPIQETSVMEETSQPRPAYVLTRGRYDALKNSGTQVTRSTPGSLPSFPERLEKNRLGLAQWLTDSQHPLTARVAVNRFWQMLFGRGLVATADNFGIQGAQPSHPELLDWLARDFIKSGWDVKATLKKMVLSATYRQESVLRPDLRAKDPENILLARGPSHRLTAEMIRDTALAGSGLLEATTGGPPVSPYMPGDLWRESNSMSPAYRQSVGGDLYRRSLYTVWKRTAPMPNMLTFDAPSREVCTVKRSATGSPQQAFVLLNDIQFVEAARVLAEKTIKEGGTNPDDRIRFAFGWLAARDPNRRETDLLKALLQEQTELFKKEPDRADKLIAVGQRKRDAALNPIELAATTILTQTIMNLDATVWKR